MLQYKNSEIIAYIETGDLFECHYRNPYQIHVYNKKNKISCNGENFRYENFINNIKSGNNTTAINGILISEISRIRIKGDGNISDIDLNEDNIISILHNNKFSRSSINKNNILNIKTDDNDLIASIDLNKVKNLSDSVYFILGDLYENPNWNALDFKLIDYGFKRSNILDLTFILNVIEDAEVFVEIIDNGHKVKCSYNEDKLISSIDDYEQIFKNIEYLEAKIEKEKGY